VKQFCWILFAGVFCVACDTLKGPHQSYLAPAVQGRIVDADSGEPLQNARVQRYLGKPTPNKDPFAEKGAQHLITVPVVNSDESGLFSIAPERGGYLLLEQPPVYEITLVIRHRTHQTLTTNIDLAKLKPVKTNDVLTLYLEDIPLEVDQE